MSKKEYMPELFRIRLREEREKRGLSYIGLARIIGCERKSLMGYEKGETCPSAITILRLCTVFGVSADYLLGRKGLA